MRQRVFIIGSGASIDLSEIGWLKFEDTIAVNYSANQLGFNPTYFLTADSGVIRSAVVHDFWNLKDTRTVVVINADEHPRWLKVEDFVPKFDEHIVPTRWNGTISLGDSQFATGKNSGFCALQYAIRLGYKEIYLLGFDLQKTNGKKYFYGEGKDSPYNLFYTHFETAFKILQNSDIKVSSCSSVSRLNALISYVSLEKLVPKMPVFISHYTINTPYQDIIEKLRVSLDTWDLDYEFTGIESLGSWRYNSNYCATQVDDMLKKFQPRPILRLDADAIVQRYPEKFIDANFNADVAGCIFENSRLVRTGEFLGGTIYFGNTEKSRKLASDWVVACDIRKDYRNGDLLYALIKKTKGLNFVKLPLSYCKIFDFKNMGNSPAVIEHFQASRTCKKIINTKKVRA